MSKVRNRQRFDAVRIYLWNPRFKRKMMIKKKKYKKERRPLPYTACEHMRIKHIALEKYIFHTIMYRYQWSFWWKTFRSIHVSTLNTQHAFQFHISRCINNLQYDMICSKRECRPSNVLNIPAYCIRNSFTYY